MNSEYVLQQLLLLQDIKYQKFHTKLIPGSHNIIGIRAPILRSLAKKLLINDWQEYLDETISQQDTYHEETILQGLIIATAKIPVEQRLKLIKNYLPKITNWAQCDMFCSTLKETIKYPDQYYNLIKQSCHAEEAYIIRFGIVMLLTYYTGDTYAKKSLELLQGICHDDYYVKMAVAWAISIFYIKQPELTLPLIVNNNLDTFTHNKAIQKICESFRVSEQDKLFMKTLRKTLLK